MAPTPIPPVEGAYVTSLPAASAAGRLVTLILTNDASASLATESVGKGTITAKGSWARVRSPVTVMILEQEGKPIAGTLVSALKDDALTFAENMSTTLAACPPGSLYDAYLRGLQAATPYIISHGKMV